MDFPAWLRAAHWINVFFLGLLIRAGIQILRAYPRLYWNEHSTPGTEWLKFVSRPIPTDRPWTALEQERDVSPWLGQPGGNNLGLGRHWHFSAAMFWVVNGGVYVVLLLATGEWQRLIPTSWSIFPDAWQALVTYLSLQQPPASATSPYDPLQQLAYAAVVFLLAPFLILTGMAQSPGVEAQIPWFARLFGGRQGARSLHFLGLVAFMLFTVIHTVMVVVTGFSKNMGDIIFGQHDTDAGMAVAIGLILIGGILAIYALTSWGSRRWPRTAQHVLGRLIRPWMRALAVRTRSRQGYPASSISPQLLVNGAPPDTSEYESLAGDAFIDWRLEVDGLVETPLILTVADLGKMPQQTQITKHHCIQGWSGIAEWSGVPLGAILDACRPLPDARFLIFHSYQIDPSGRPFYESVDIGLARHPQTILASRMNGEALSIPHGAPLRLRVETELGFKMVKWLRRIEFVAGYRDLGDGQGGSREDTMFYEQAVGI
jgi:DMSO/TMAO reductase YedYZ molybdopterin-dependent catalytic subunit/thiosulfate reductase cytochrome b subunit